MEPEFENDDSEEWCGLASIAAGNRACETLVEKYNLWAEMEDLYKQYLPEEIKRLDALWEKNHGVKVKAVTKNWQNEIT